MNRTDTLPIEPFDFDDAMIAAVREDGRPRVEVYAWQSAMESRRKSEPGPPELYPGKLLAAVLGRSGKPEVELNPDALRADGVTVMKRQGGGCAVLLDPGNVIVSVVLPLPGLGKLRAAFGAISDWLIKALAEAGVPGVKQKGCSDLALDERKIGGSCIYRARDLLYYSTTLLVAPDLDLVERYIAHPPREPDYRRGRKHRDFMGRLLAPKDPAEVPRLAADLRRLLDARNIPL